MEQNTLKGRTALIVGGGTGIGQATAVALAQAGCQSAIAGRRNDKLEATCRSFDGPGEILSHVADVTDRQSIGELVAWFTTTIGPLDILVNSAGINIQNRTMSTMRPEQWDQIMAVNATGAYNCMAAVLPHMRERAEGIIINISSMAGKRAIQLGGVAYCASKFAMTALGTAVGQEEAKHGIRVTNVYPGEVDTPLLEQRANPVSEEHRATMLQPDDVAQMVVAICSLPARAHVPEIMVKPRLQGYC